MSQPLGITGVLVQSPIPAASPSLGGDVVIDIGVDKGYTVEPLGSPSSRSTVVESIPHSSKLPFFYRRIPLSNANLGNRKALDPSPGGSRDAPPTSTEVLKGLFLVDYPGCLNRGHRKRHGPRNGRAIVGKAIPRDRTGLTPGETVDKHPNGYPRLAAFMESDESFKMYRQFGYVHTRVLLHLQCELADMETRLKMMDERDSQDERRKVFLQSQKRDSAEPERGTLLSEFRVKLKEYGTQ
jgi:hypothetical protein